MRPTEYSELGRHPNGYKLMNRNGSTAWSQKEGHLIASRAHLLEVVERKKCKSFFGASLAYVSTVLVDNIILEARNWVLAGGNI